MKTSDEKSGSKAMKLKPPTRFLTLMRSNKSVHLNWEMLAIWSLVVVSFAALVFAGYVIGAKCHGR